MTTTVSPEYSSAAQPPRPEGINYGEVATDQSSIQHFYKLKGEYVHPVATDSFIGKSREEYNPAWLTREIVQNFVDHNPQAPGTLNGVRLTIEDLPNDLKRFRIEGDWPFEDPTGILSPHSDKPEGMNTAGGNGIGLKQTAIRFLRDFGVQRFDIEGDGWNVNYHLAKAQDVNREWAEMPGQTPTHQIRHDWLLANVSQADRRDQNAYIIETGDPTVITALSQISSLGVSSENPYLQNLDYQNQHGAIKWLPRTQATTESQGRLFINGQVMNYKRKGKSIDDYWVGPEEVTIQLNNVNYQISIDRPPLSPWDLRKHMNALIKDMSKDDLIDQLKKSEAIWKGQTDRPYSFDQKGAFVVIQKMVEALRSESGYNPDQYKEIFPDRNYLCWNSGVSDSQIKDLETQGYIICSSYFEDIGMPTASSKLDSLDVASNEKPKLDRYSRDKMAQDLGLEVGFEDFSAIQSIPEFFKTFGQGLASRIIDTEEREGRPNTTRIKLNGGIPVELLSRSILRGEGESSKLLNFLRGAVAYGLTKKIFKNIFISQGEFVTTFGLDYDLTAKEYTLIARNVKSSNTEGLFVEIEFDEKYYADFRATIDKVLTDLKSNPSVDQPLIVTDRPIHQPAIDKETKLPSEVKGQPLNPNQEPWTTQEEELYKKALTKNEADLTDEEQIVINKHKRLKQQLEAIPVEQPDAPKVQFGTKVVQKEPTRSPAEAARLAQMEKQLPGIVDLVNKLDSSTPRSTIVDKETPMKKYLKWRSSDQFYGRLAEESQYLSGKHLVEIVAENEQAEISVVNSSPRQSTPEEKTLDALRNKLKSIVGKLAPKDDVIDDFELIYDPTEKQLAQLGLLRVYAQLTTGVILPNDLFIYQGSGSKGINLGQKAIGLHESLFKVKFTEALGTFAHEIAHNYPMALNHENMWRHAQEAIFVSMNDKISQIARRSSLGQEITPEDRVVLDIQNQWERLLTD